MVNYLFQNDRQPSNMQVFDELKWFCFGITVKHGDMYSKQNQILILF